MRLDAEVAGEPPFVSGDIGLIERVLENLIENAVKYTPSGGTVRLTMLTVDDGVTVAVSDTGPGIEAKHLSRLFDRFFRADQPQCSTNKGAGLGLAIAQRILQLHDGAITVDSTPGKGSSFSFHLSACPR